MICQKCNQILTGSESFCPCCGTPCTREKDCLSEADSPSAIFTEDKSSTARIFTSEPLQQHMEVKKGRRLNTGLLLIAVLLIVVIGVLGVSAAGLIDFRPAIASLLSTAQQTTAPEETVQESEGEYNPLSSIVMPSLSYKTTVAYTSSEGGQALRKGPEDSYGQLTVVPSGTCVHIIGSDRPDSDRVYVYIPELDMYGWLSDSLLSVELTQRQQETEGEEGQ